MKHQRNPWELTETEVDRFRSYVPEADSNGCRLWMRERNSTGYGRFAIWRGKRTAKKLLAHRVAYVLAGNDLPAGGRLLHSCDVPACIEPTHLRVGSQAENIKDAIARGRHVPPPHPRGEAHAGARLTRAQVEEIRRRRDAGTLNKTRAASEFGVSRATIYSAAIGRTWGSA